ncbi:hypothetical protein P168DRAFT_301265 [Aspergillus campestris IBT 28561]|uniref:FAS1 domain-containing protein n=1 Tax=Aspergillus campestris (strain IBT 28561) TaxID=1392248 RepID=A0A2I1DFE0_ASPC2|nr:uncharacterized protein P168DRAFT_301265 [Aspergillus campestris IBT 28561]PKY08592.1 hypothetical protein P168DRAFT_301265 [Aspergillus campestris IBT 28561]
MKLSPWPALALLPLTRGIVLPQQFPFFPPTQDPNQNQSPNPLDIALDAEPSSDTSPQHNWLSALIDAETDNNNNGNYNLPATYPQSLSQTPGFRSSPPNRPHHPPSNKTLYQLITECKHTTILARIVSKDDELTRLLKASDANVTLFAPPDSAFKSGGDSEEDEEENFVAKYHLLDGLYPTVRIFHAQTLPTLLVGDELGDDLPQRVVVRFGWRGIVINQYSRIVVSDIKATNGLLHIPTDILTPPKSTKNLIDEDPSQFSTLALALHKTNLSLPLSSHPSSNLHPQREIKKKTTLAPTNTAFAKLGSKTTSFLFSPQGQPYLRRLLQYHIVPDRAIYTDVVYGANGSVTEIPPAAFTHLDVPSEDEDDDEDGDGDGGAHLGIDIVRFGVYASVKVNGYTRVTGRDVVVSDGAVQVLGHVLVPPLRVGGSGDGNGGWGREVAPEWTGEEDEVTVEDLKRRLGGEGVVEGVHGEL